MAPGERGDEQRDRRVCARKRVGRRALEHADHPPDASRQRAAFVRDRRPQLRGYLHRPRGTDGGHDRVERIV
ncbi:MAG TPA: hypothetical protein VIW45_17510, partial [Vicinamibacterales bacterium]